MNPNSSKRCIPFSCDLHIHSALSPCAEDRMIPTEVLKKICSLGIDIFSITDHNAGFNSAAFETAAKKFNILFIPGIELQTSEEIHLLGYFLDINTLNSFCSTIVKPKLPPNMKNDPARFGHQIKINSAGNIVGEEEDMLILPLSISIDELVTSIHAFNGIAVAAHLDRGFSVISQLGFIPPQLPLDAVEIWDVNKVEDIRSNFLKSSTLSILSSSDSHYLDMMKPPKMKFWLKNANVQNCLNCIKGSGEGKVTVRSKTYGKNKKTIETRFGTDNNISPHDWKNLYK